MTIRLASETRRLVHETTMFKDLAPPILDEILADCQIEEHPAGTVLFRQGEPSRAFFIVLDGWAKVYRITSEGEEVVVGLFTRGQTFAEAVALLGEPFPAHGETVTNARLLRVPGDGLRERILGDPAIGLSMLASTAEHLHRLVCEIEEIKTRTGAQRVAEFLTSLTDVEQGSCTVTLPFPKMLIAGRLGMKQETLSRAFARLRTSGVVVEGSTVSVDDIGQLRASTLA